MDERRFDELTRRLGAAASRRQVLGGLAGAVLGYFGGVGAAVSAQTATGGAPCGGAVCGAGEFCCNPSCGPCAPIGGACTLQACETPAGEPCNAVTCGAGEFCCNHSCSTCAPVGGACTAQLCEPGGGFAIGAVVVTTAALNYRVGPGLGAEILAVLPPGTRGGILDGPVAVDGYGWYQLGIPGYGPDGATPGWVAGEYLALA